MYEHPKVHNHPFPWQSVLLACAVMSGALSCQCTNRYVRKCMQCTDEVTDNEIHL